MPEVRARWFELVALGLLTAFCGSDSSNLLTFDGPIALSRLRVRGDGGETLWEIQSRAGLVTLGVIRYGVTPAGFVQVVPKGSPRPFKRDENLAVLTVLDGRLNCHRGAADGPTGFRAGVWNSIPVDHPRNAEADMAFASVLECKP
jgi:hypothetical protein